MKYFLLISLLCAGPAFSAGLSKDDAAEAAVQLGRQHLESIRESRAAEMKAKVIEIDGKKMPFYYKVFGEMPDDGWSLFISMNGGGGAPPEVNDSQWENQKRLYQPKEGIYFVPRAPTNSWNLWHEGHIDAFFDRIVFEDLNPNKVYIMG